MLLWDYEMREVLPQIDDLSARQRFALSVRAIKHASTFDGDFIEEWDEETAAFVQRSLAQADEALAAGRTSLATSDGFHEEADDLLDAAEELDGVETFLTAVINLYGYPETGMGPEHVTAVLSFGYQCILERQAIEVVTPDAERENPNCVRFIEEQKQLVRSASE